MNIIIPYRKDPHSGLELKYALRSIDKYLTGYDKVIIIGDWFPEWLDNTVNVTKYEESRKTPQNILSKIITGLGVAGGEALQWQDDIYLTRPLNVSEIKYWYDGDLERAIYKHQGSYRQIILNTALKLTESTLFYDTHTPIVYHREGVERIRDSYDWSRGYLIKTMFAAGKGGQPYKDCKIGQPVPDISAAIGDSLFFSTGPQGVCQSMIDYWESNCPEKSRFEK